MEKNIHILDTTLRDGSYAVATPFSAEDTARICQGLDEAGIEFIEIGNGAGLNAQKLGWAKSAATDEEYMKAAKNVVRTAAYGFFCVPGIARLEDVDLAHRYGVGFLRMGVYPDRIATSKDFITRAKKYRMLVSVNLLKSYVLSPQEFASYAKLVESYGADVLYIVDSAGGMFPKDVLSCFQAIRQVSQIAIGFHGHDNLGFAVANSIAVADAGASFIDVSLQGLGRSAGNATAEVLLFALKKHGYEFGIDVLKIMELGELLVRPRLLYKGKEPLDVVAGYADYAFFESSYLSLIIRVAQEKGLHPAFLMIEVCKKDKLRPLPQDQLEKIADVIKEKGLRL